ncbi:SusC/RagA family TonB-linked outer membrane protein [Chryseobacterium indologenes]|uniref:SusC/RagA family TonB-linked outer membrane protein n=1 Tax=Chryseobacterium indologenes TaxID=253 RepID=UPI001109B6BD|nr:SusC/RagA family TonB-linked outer membrane protein [Chryseobacterium indologenes]TLX26580.1 SusC/RagA family TonB-linked outer membrane protein [Chryseobacterium indologenes]
MKKSYFNIGGIFFGLILTTISISATAQTSTISGTVTSAGKPLSGVTISQEGSDQMTTTNESGTYRIEVSKENPILLFRHPEYAEERINIGNQSVINISLEQKVKGIEEVILNAGYYKVKDKERTGSIAKISSKDIENQPVTNVLSAAQGRLAGVSITQGGGTAGGGFDVQIRGQNSLRREGNIPLYVIDGVPMGAGITSQYSTQVLPMLNINPLNAINPNDIESIEVLKDADATAIYGSRGANGVILVTTKNGKAGKVSFSLNSSFGVSKALIGLQMMNTQQYLNMRQQAFKNDGIASYPATAYDVNGSWNPNFDTDWLKQLIGNTATSSDVRLSVTGGSKSTQFIISAGHNEQTTVFDKNFKYATNSLTSQLTHKSEDNRFSISLSNMLSQQKNNVLNEDVTNKATLLPPNAPALYKPDGSINWENNTFVNPMAGFNATYQNENFQQVTNLVTQLELVPNVTVKLNAGLTHFQFGEKSLRPNTIYNPAFVTGQSSFYSAASKSSHSQLSYILEPQISWDLKKERHGFSVLLGSSFQNETNKREAMTGSGFESNAFIDNLAAAQTKNIVEQSETEYRYAGFFVRLNYQFDHKYIINITGRRDGSSRFGSNKKFANFGAVGAAWLFSKEKALQKLTWLSFGKIRASFGTAGSDNIGDYQYLNTYIISTQGYNGVTGLDPSRLYNPDYSWEKTQKLEVALETAFLNNRVNMTASYYRNKSSNQLVGYQLPATTGFASVLANLAASIENKGFELEVGGTPIKGKDFKWESSFNISIPKNKLLSFPGLDGSTYANRYVIGEPTSIIKLYQLEGIDPATGVYQFTDFNGDGKISSPDDNRVIEKIGVRYFGGWSNTITWKNWNLGFLFQGVKQRNLNYNTSMPLPGGLFNQPVEVLDVWSPANPNGSYMPYSTGISNNPNTAQTNFRSSTATVSDASFIRLKNIQITYRIPLKDTVIKDVSIYVQGQNVWTITKYFGMDPEFTARGYLPPLKSFVFGAQFNF